MSNASATLVAASTATAALDLPYDITANGDTGILRDESWNISLKSACSARMQKDHSPLAFHPLTRQQKVHKTLVNVLR